MWILRKLGNTNDTIFRIISAKGSYSVGRKSKDIVLDDTSISRNHCTIHIAKSNDCPFSVDTATGVWVIDEGSKYGTFVKQADFVKLDKNVVKKLEQNSIVRFGLLENVFKVEYKPIVACTSMVTKEQTEQCKKILSEIDGCLKNNFDKQCSLVIVNSVTLTKKVVLALINGVPVVLPGYLKELAEAIKNGTPLPDYKAFKPPIGEKALRENLVSLDIKDTRKDLFKGKTFVVPMRNQYENLKDIIVAAGGKIEMLDNNCNWHRFAGENIVIVKYPLDAPAEIVNGYKKNSEMLKEKYSKRIVPESEIPQAIAYSTTEKFCNPKCVFEVRKSLEENSKGDVIEEETPTVSERSMLEGSLNLVPGSATQSEAESNSISILDVRPGISINRKRGLSPEVPTPSKKPTMDSNLSNTASQLESQSLMPYDKEQQTEKSNDSRNNKNIVEKRPSFNRPIIQIDNDPNSDDFWSTPHPSQPNPTTSTKRKQSDDISPPRVEPVSKKTRTVSNDMFEPATSSKNKNKSKNSRKSPARSVYKSPPRVEPVSRKTRTVSDDMFEPATSSKNKDKAKNSRKSPARSVDKSPSKKTKLIPESSTSSENNGRKSPSPKSGPSSYSKPTISAGKYEPDGEWISFGNYGKDVKKEDSEELNNTVVMLNLVSISYRNDEGIKEPPSVLQNVKRFRKQNVIATREYVPVEQVSAYDDSDDDDWTNVRAFSQQEEMA